MRKIPKFFLSFFRASSLWRKTEILFHRKPAHEPKWSNGAAYILCERAADDVLLQRLSIGASWNSHHLVVKKCCSVIFKNTEIYNKNIIKKYKKALPPLHLL
jgi:hypothetical protein